LIFAMPPPYASRTGGHPGARAVEHQDSIACARATFGE
jgi:hypothetical protein